MSGIVSPGLTNVLVGAPRKPATPLAEKAQKGAQDFEAVFLNSMFQQMFTGVGKGPYSGGNGASAWRSFLTDEYAKSFAKKGGIGIADQVRKELLARQEIPMSQKIQ